MVQSSSRQDGRNGAKAAPELGLPLDMVTFIIVKAREYDVKEADGDPDVGLGERRGVVYAIPDKGHNLSFFLQGLYFGNFLAREDFGNYPVDTEHMCDGFSSATVVAGYHDYMNPV